MHIVRDFERAYVDTDVKLVSVRKNKVRAFFNPAALLLITL